MMAKTQTPCDCAAVTEMLNRPEVSGLTYVEGSGFALGKTFVVYHCPYCGGRLPRSKAGKTIWFPRLTQEERARLMRLIDGIVTPEEAIERLGLPTYDSRGESLEVSQDFSFYYDNLSEHANIEMNFAPNRPIEYRIQIKPIPPHHVDSDKK